MADVFDGDDDDEVETDEKKDDKDDRNPKKGDENEGAEASPENYRTKMALLNELKILANKTTGSDKSSLLRVISRLTNTRQANTTMLGSMLYLACPYLNGVILGFGKYGFGKLCPAGADWLAHIRKICVERYGTVFKDCYIFM